MTCTETWQPCLADNLVKRIQKFKSNQLSSQGHLLLNNQDRFYFFVPNNILNLSELKWIVRPAPITQNKNPSGADFIHYKPSELDWSEFSLGKEVSSGHRWKVKILGQFILGVVAVWEANFNAKKLVDFVYVVWYDHFVESPIQSLHLKCLSVFKKLKNGWYELLSGKVLWYCFSHLNFIWLNKDRRSDFSFYFGYLLARWF